MLNLFQHYGKIFQIWLVILILKSHVCGKCSILIFSYLITTYFAISRLYHNQTSFVVTEGGTTGWVRRRRRCPRRASGTCKLEGRASGYLIRESMHEFLFAVVVYWQRQFESILSYSSFGFSRFIYTYK